MENEIGGMAFFVHLSQGHHLLFPFLFSFFVQPIENNSLSFHLDFKDVHFTVENN